MVDGDDSASTVIAGDCATGDEGGEIEASLAAKYASEPP